MCSRWQPCLYYVLASPGLPYVLYSTTLLFLHRYAWQRPCLALPCCASPAVPTRAERVASSEETRLSFFDKKQASTRAGVSGGVRNPDPSVWSWSLRQDGCRNVAAVRSCVLHSHINIVLRPPQTQCGSTFQSFSTLALARCIACPLELLLTTAGFLCFASAL